MSISKKILPCLIALMCSLELCMAGQNFFITNSNDAGIGSFRDAAVNNALDFNGASNTQLTFNYNFSPNLAINILNDITFQAPINNTGVNATMMAAFNGENLALQGNPNPVNINFNNTTTELSLNTNSKISIVNSSIIFNFPNNAVTTRVQKNGSGLLSLTGIDIYTQNFSAPPPILEINDGSFEGITNLGSNLSINTTGTFSPGYTSFPEDIGNMTVAVFNINNTQVVNLGLYQIAVSPQNGLTSSLWQSVTNQIFNPMTVGFIPVNQPGSYQVGATSIVYTGDVDTDGIFSYPITNGLGNPVTDISEVIANPVGTFNTPNSQIDYTLELLPGIDGTTLNTIRLTITAIHNFAHAVLSASKHISTIANMTEVTTSKMQTTIQDIIRNRQGFLRRCPGLKATEIEYDNQLKVLDDLHGAANFNNIRQIANNIPNRLPQNTHLPKDIFPTNLPIVFMNVPSHRVWGQAVGDISRQDKTHNNIGYRAKSGGLFAGYEYQWTCYTLIGLLGGYYKTDGDYKNDNGQATIKRPVVGIYGRYIKNRWSLDGSLTYSRLRVSQVRKLANNLKAHSHYHGNNFYTEFAIGYNLFLPNRWLIIPSIQVGWNRYLQSSYREHRAQVNNLHVHDHRSSVLLGGIEVLVSKVFRLERVFLAPQFKIGYIHESEVNGKKYRYRPQGDSTYHHAPIAKAARNNIKVGTTFAAYFVGDWQLYTSYQGLLWRKFQSHELALGIKRSF